MESKLKPCVVVFHGPPLEGKTVLAYALKRVCPDLILADVDEVRQRLVPNPMRILLLDAGEEERLTMVSSYAMLCKEAATALRLNPECSMVLTGTFSRSEFKLPLEILAEYLHRMKIPLRVFLLDAPDEEIERRIEMRQREGSASNIDTLEKFKWAKEFFQPIAFAPVVTIETSKSPDECAEEAIRYLSDLIVV